MAKKLYTEVGGVAHKVKKLYTEVGGMSHKVKRLYAEVGGVSKLVYSARQPVRFTKYEQSVGNLYGSYRLSDTDGVLHAQISGYTGGETNNCAIGWMIDNIPAGAEVEITYEWYKGGFEMNDILIYSANGTLATHSANGVIYTNTLKTTSHAGWILAIVNFFPASYYATTSWLTIKSVVVNGERDWP